jgi:hypothetical protein
MALWKKVVHDKVVVPQRAVGVWKSLAVPHRQARRKRSFRESA